ncbi:MAG: flagellar assembly peptidoglycan hydrolase FlgJ [Burkholderiaceae bacterium]
MRRLDGPQAAFVDRMWSHALAAQRASGVPAAFVVGQAALESGWGRHEIRHPDGRSAHNLFGIKATGGWQGATVEVPTTEYVDGKPQRVVERFRAYGSYAEAFRDWAGLMSKSPRYRDVVRADQSVEGFAQGMQRAGYATDPRYGSKLESTINQTLLLKRLVI